MTDEQAGDVVSALAYAVATPREQKIYLQTLEHLACALWAWPVFTHSLPAAL